MEKGKVDVCLVVPPVTECVAPYLGVSLLKSCLAREGISCCVDYANIYFISRLGKDYVKINTALMDDMEGEFIFNGPAGIDNGYTVDDLERYYEKAAEERPYFILAKKRISKFDGKFIERCCRIAAEETENTVIRILEKNPKIVGCSNIFAQRNASLAILRRIKELRPDIVTVMGGYNCSGEKGLAIMKKYGFIDYIFSGESDDIFGPVIGSILKGEDFELPEGVICSRKALPDKLEFRTVSDMETIPTPDFDDYFEMIDSPEYADIRELFKCGRILTLETSRGCWWGERKSCTFCGACTDAKRYRARSPESVVSDLEILIGKYGDKFIEFTDFIMPKNISELAERIRLSRYRYKIFGEVKSNLGDDDIKTLKECGFVKLQPGIENINDHVLELMNKGVSGIQNIAFLKHCEKYHIIAAWNYLIGTPGETPEDINEALDIIPLIEHLAPTPAAIPVEFCRGNAYCNHPERYGLELMPGRSINFYSPADETYIMETAFIFDRGNGYKESADEIKLKSKLTKAVDDWLHRPDETFLYMKTGETLEIMDTRKVRVREFHRLDGIKRDIYLAANEPVGIDFLPEKLGCSENEIRSAVAELTEDKLLLSMNGKILALAVEISGKAYDSICLRRMFSGINN